MGRAHLKLKTHFFSRYSLTRSLHSQKYKIIRLLQGLKSRETSYSILSLACENTRFSSLFAAGEGQGVMRVRIRTHGKIFSALIICLHRPQCFLGQGCLMGTFNSKSVLPLRTASRAKHIHRVVVFDLIQNFLQEDQCFQGITW